MDIIVSTVFTSVLITATILAVTAFLATVYLISMRLALPFGALLFNTLISSFNIRLPSTPAQKGDILHTQKVLSGLVALILHFSCVLYEQIKAGSSYRPLGFNEFLSLTAKGCVEGVIVLGMLRSVYEGYKRLA